MGALEPPHVDPFGEWAGSKSPSLRRRPAGGFIGGGLRFAFYGRTSTVDHQDRWSSCGWQREAAEQVIAGRGMIVAEFFDVGCSRRVPWAQRPRAAALLAEIAGVGRRFDAIVVGEYERAFAGGLFTRLISRLGPWGVQVWLPEAEGPVDVTSPTHQALMGMLGAQSERESLRARHRVLAAMRMQACEQGRYLGGRPPYGYRLVDAGLHPNRADARWGRRLQRLDPDPVTAPYVQWIFARRLAGVSKAGIARALNERGVPCPSGADPVRNPHRSGREWTTQTVAEILANPRYTGRQVWDRRGSGDPGGEVRGWVISRRITHPPLVSDADFVAAQSIRAARPTRRGIVRVYRFAGCLRCGVCGRRVDSHWVNDRPGYRCRHGRTTARPRDPGEAKALYLREDHLIVRLAAILDLDPDRPDEIAVLLRSTNQVAICDGATCTIVARGRRRARPAQLPRTGLKRSSPPYGEITCPRPDRNHLHIMKSPGASRPPSLLNYLRHI